MTNDDKNTGRRRASSKAISDNAGRAQLAYSGRFPRPDRGAWPRPGRHAARVPRRPVRAGQRTISLPASIPSMSRSTAIPARSSAQWGTNLHLDYHFEGLGTLYSITGYESGRVESTGDIDGGNSYTFTDGALGDRTSVCSRTTPAASRSRANSARSCVSPPTSSAGCRLPGRRLLFPPEARATSELAYTWPPTGIAIGRSQPGYRALRLEHELRHLRIGSNTRPTDGPDAARRRRATAHDHKNDRVTGCSRQPAFGRGRCRSRAKVSGSAVTWDASATYAITPADQPLCPRRDRLSGARRSRIASPSSARQTTSPKEADAPSRPKAASRARPLDHTLRFALDGY